ncbi:MAG: translocation/assembly module TamB domain-containing protein [Myxococcales bacterium]|nr:translocation/assembly module TamB domain-containing protein [Myxococcales bacterium]
MANLPQDGESWQAEADLLADGRDHLDRLTDSLRYRHLYPNGTNLAILLAAYQEVWRERTVGRLQGSRRRLLRRFRRAIRDGLRRDVVDRSQRLTHGYPSARPALLTTPIPGLVERALARVDEDARPEVQAHIHGEANEVVASASVTGLGPGPARLARGLEQLRRGLINEALANPAALPALHPQYLRFARAPLPTKRRHPIANLLFVKLPLYFWLTILLIFNLAYLGAWKFFNDETLGRFLGTVISPFIDGDLEFGSVHWQPRLIIDLITGTPTPVKVRGFRIYEGHKYFDLPQRRVTAYADEIDAELVLHEIIPWNRLGVPPVFEIPWFLHFTRVRAPGPVQLWVRQYALENRAGDTEWRLSLTGAFQPPDDEPAPPDTRGISFKVDDFVADDLTLDIDLRTSGRWQDVMHLRQAHLVLQFFGEHPKEPPRERLPLAFQIDGEVDEGLLDLLSLGSDGYHLPLRDLKLTSIRSGDDEVPFGDLELHAEGKIGGSPVAIDGVMVDFMADDPRVDMALAFDDVGPMAGIIVAAHELPASMVDADGVPALLSIRGPISDPTLNLAAEGLRIHPDEEHPEWVIDDADVSVALTRDPIPETWEDRFDPGEERWMAEFGRFDAIFLDGPMSLREHAIPTRVLLPEGDDPAFLITADLELRGVDPGLLQERPAGGGRPLLGGALRGHLGVPKLVVDFSGEAMEVTHAAADLDDLTLTRDAGPAIDGLPRTIKADGGITYDSEEGIAIDAASIAVNGGRVEIDGGTDGAIKSLRPTDVALRVSDGAAFLGEFGLDPYFDRLDSRLTLSGPLGAPNGSGGALTVSGVGKGDVAVTGIDRASLWMERGELKVRSPNIALLGGRGRLSVDLALFENGEATSDPRLRLSADLSGLEIARVSDGLLRGAADLQLEVGDAAGKAVPISKFQARGALYVPTLEMGEATFRDAETKFDIDTERVTISTIRLPYHRKVSPHIAPEVTIAAGELGGRGSVGFDDDTTLDLHLSAWGLPLSLFAEAGGLAEFPVGGQVSPGTSIDISGPLSRPALSGKVALTAMSASGIPLGRGTLELSTEDLAAGGGLGERREVRLGGAFTRRKAAADPADKLDWTMRGLVAFGTKPRKGDAPFAAEITADFGHLPVSNLLHGSEDGLRDTVAGQLEGLRVRARVCDPQVALIENCRGSVGADAHDLGLDLRVDMELDRLWIRERGGKPADPCDDPTSLCSKSQLAATLDGTEIRLGAPWTLRSGGNKEGQDLTLTGTVDLSEAAVEDAGECRSSSARAAARARSPGGGYAQLRGDVALSALTPFLKPMGVRDLRGKVGVNLGVRGHINDPVVEGSVDVPATEMQVSVAIGDTTWAITVPSLLVKIAGDHVFPAGSIKISGQQIDFGDYTKGGGETTYYTLAGPCAGNFAVAAQGTIDGALIGELLPDVFTRAGGALRIENFFVAGQTAEEFAIEMMRLSVTPGDRPFTGTLTLPEIQPIELSRGVAEVVRCSIADPCPDSLDGYAAFLGGRQGAAANAAPSSALWAKIGDRGRATAWGHIVLSPDFDQIRDSRIHVALDEVGYKQFDNSGRPELLATVSSEDVVLEGRDSLILRGEILIERSRWIRDAQEGVKVLSFADPSTAPESPPPEIVRDMQLDLRLRTTAPFRVDNNVMKGVEGQVALTIGGTVSDLDLAGRVDVGTGVLDLTILGSAFDIQYGKVTLAPDFDESAVDVLATRQEPLYIDGQPRQMSVRLSGTLDAINMQCIVQGEARTRARTTRECVDYLVLGAGSREQADTSGVRRTGGGGLLGKPIGLVGSLTELKLDRYVEESAPRIAPYVPDMGLRLGQYGIEIEAETPRPWFRSEWGNLSVGAGYTRGYPGLLLRNSYNWRVRFQILDNATIELRDSKRSYYNERIIFDPLRQRSLELRIDHQLPSLR